MVASYPSTSASFCAKRKSLYVLLRPLTHSHSNSNSNCGTKSTGHLRIPPLIIAVQFIPNCSSPSHRTPALALAARRRGSRGATQPNPTQPNPNKVWGIVVYYYWLYVEKERVAFFGSDRSTWLKVEFVNEKISPDKDCCWVTTADNVFWEPVPLA